jgi:DNA-binding NarL/FixJ family response regulator
MIGRVLIVDDHDTWRGKLRAALANHPRWAVIAEASNGLEAVRTAATFKPDVIVLDIELPVLNGIGAAREILALDPRAKILFVSGHRSAAIVGAALAAGARGYVLKSDAHQLVAAMDAIGDGKRFISDGLRCEGDG